MRTLSDLITVLKGDAGHQITLHVCKTHSKSKDTFKGEVYSNKISLKLGFFQLICNLYYQGHGINPDIEHIKVVTPALAK